MDTATESKKSVKRLSFVALIFAAIVFGLLAGLGGSMLLTHSLIQRPLQEQQVRINAQYVEHRQEMALLLQHLAQQDSAIRQLKDEISNFIMADSTGYLKELASIQKENKNRENVFLQEIETLKNQIVKLENSNQEFNALVENGRQDLERADKALRDDLRMLQSSMNDLKSQLQQLERQISAR